MTNPDTNSLLRFIFEEADETTVPNECDELLHAYIEFELAEGTAASKYPQVHECIETLPNFRLLYEEVKALLIAEKTSTFIDSPETAILPEAFVESFVRQKPEKIKQYRVQWNVTDAGRLIIQLTGKLVDSVRKHSELIPNSLDVQKQASLILAGGVRSSPRQLPQFELKGIVDDMEVEIKSQDSKQGADYCQIVVRVNIPSRGGWPNLADTEVVLRQEKKQIGKRFTDAHGIVIFPTVLIEALDKLSFEISPST